MARPTTSTLTAKPFSRLCRVILGAHRTEHVQINPCLFKFFADAIDWMSYKCHWITVCLWLLLFFGSNRMKTIGNSTHLNQIHLRMTSKPKIKGNSPRTFFFCGNFIVSLCTNDVIHATTLIFFAAGVCSWNRWIGGGFRILCLKARIRFDQALVKIVCQYFSYSFEHPIWRVETLMTLEAWICFWYESYTPQKF